ncbi:MAG: hypothetical protein ACE5R6_15130 [Candidatus Heimdallarchaeota archaeon]
MKDKEHEFATRNSLDEILEHIENAIKNTKFSLQDVLNVTRHLLVCENGSIKARARETIAPEVRKYLIGERNLRAILEILRKVKIIRTEGHRTIPLERATVLLEYLHSLPEEAQINKNVWSEIEKAAKRDGHNPREIFAVVKHLFVRKGELIRCRGRERVVKKTVAYNIGGKKLRKLLAYLEQEGIIGTSDKTRFPTARGEQLYHQLEQGQIPAELPPRSDRLTKQKEDLKQKIAQYLVKYKQRYGKPPDEETAKQFLVKIWDLPTFTRKDLVKMLTEKTGVNLSGASLSRYKLGQREMPEHICAALHEISIELDVERLKERQKTQQEQLKKRVETARNALRELFEKGFSFPKLSKQLESLGLNISAPVLAHMSRGTQKILSQHIPPILELHHRISTKYPAIPTVQEIADMISMLNNMGYSTLELARQVHKKLPPPKKREIQFNGVSKALREFKKKPDRKKPIPLSFRLAIKQVYDELLLQQKVVIDKPIQKIAEELQSFNLPMDPRKAKFTDAKIRKGLAIVLIAKRLQEYFYGEFRDRRTDRPDHSRVVAPIGSRRIAAFARAKGVDLTYNNIEQFQRILEQGGFLEQGWLPSGKKKWLDSIITLSDLFCLEIFYLSRIRGLDYLNFQKLLGLLKHVTKAPQAAIADLLGIDRKTFYTAISNLERYQVVTRDVIGDLLLTPKGELLANRLPQEIDEIINSNADLEEQLVLIGKINNYKAALGDILFEYILERLFPDYQIIATVQPVGEHGIDRVLKKEEELIGVELKARMKSDPIWRTEKTFRILLRHNLEMKRNYGKFPHHMLLITTADTSEYFQMIAYRVSKQMKTYRSTPILRYTQNRLADGTLQLRFLYDFSKKRWIRSEDSLENTDNSGMRNKKWFEVFIIGDKQIREVIKDNNPAQELLALLQTSREEVVLPESPEETLDNWKKRIIIGGSQSLRSKDCYT